MRLAATLTFLVVVSTFPTAIRAQEFLTGPKRYGTVKIFFVNQYLPDPMHRMGGPPGGLIFETTRIFLDDEFVGNSILRNVDVKPTLNVPPGEHTFRIECDGYKDFESKLHVLQNGSTQWLVVELERLDKPKDAKALSRPEKNESPDGLGGFGGKVSVD